MSTVHIPHKHEVKGENSAGFSPGYSVQRAQLIIQLKCNVVSFVVQQCKPEEVGRGCDVN